MNFKAFVILLVVPTLTACSALGGATPEPLPTIVLGNDNASVRNQTTAPGGGSEATASGIIVPAEQSQMVFTSGGRVSRVNVAVGDLVEARQVLVELAGKEKLTAEVQAAEMEVLAAQQALDALDDDMDVKQAQALKAIADNQDAVRDAERKLYNLQTISEQFDVDAAFANMIIARDKLEQAREDFEPYENKPEDNVVRAGLLSQLAQAQREYEALVRQYNNLLGTANQIDVSQAEADLAIARADLTKSQRDYESLLKGPDPDEVALAEARLATANAQLEAAQYALEDLELRAPFGGTITHVYVHASEWVTPGQAVVGLSDLENLRVETTDLSERDVPQIVVGQAVNVYIEALNIDVQGKVIQISPLADTLGGDTVYKTTIELDTRPPGLRAGMSVEVQFRSR
jgi:HlyD family secretion protein